MTPDLIKVIAMIVLLAFVFTLPIVFGPTPDDFQPPKETDNEHPDQR
jgi:hypothetical protein